MLPAPRQKQPQISPILISDKVTLHVSREKDGKLRLGYAGIRRCEGRSAGRLRASSQGVKGWILPPWQGERDDPPSKTRTPLRPPPGFSSHSLPLPRIPPRPLRSP